MAEGEGDEEEAGMAGGRVDAEMPPVLLLSLLTMLRVLIGLLPLALCAEGVEGGLSTAVEEGVTGGGGGRGLAAAKGGGDSDGILNHTP